MPRVAVVKVIDASVLPLSTDFSYVAQLFTDAVEMSDVALNKLIRAQLALRKLVEAKGELYPYAIVELPPVETTVKSTIAEYEAHVARMHKEWLEAEEKQRKELLEAEEKQRKEKEERARRAQLRKLAKNREALKVLIEQNPDLVQDFVKTQAMGSKEQQV